MKSSTAIVLLGCVLSTAAVANEPSQAPATAKKIVFLPGQGSHGWGGHAHTAGSMLLAKRLNENVPGIQAVVHKGGWPSDPKVLEDAAAIIIYCDGNSVVGPHFQDLAALVKKGVGVAFMHYALDAGKDNGSWLLDAIGGYYEQHWSINPYWTAKFKELPEHPIARGVRPFAMEDEWYYHMRFREGMKGVTPILSAVPPESTRRGPDGPHSGNPTVRARKGMSEHVAWAYERPDGSRGFGITGGHLHLNWSHDGLRKLMLNAIVWIAKVEVPAEGVSSARPTAEEIEANQESPRPEQWTREEIQKEIEKINRR